MAHGVALYDLDDSETARVAVLRMLSRWSGGVATVQQLHDDAGVQPLPPFNERDYSRKTPAGVPAVCYSPNAYQ